MSSVLPDCGRSAVSSAPPDCGRQLRPPHPGRPSQWSCGFAGCSFEAGCQTALRRGKTLLATGVCAVWHVIGFAAFAGRSFRREGLASKQGRSLLRRKVVRLQGRIQTATLTHNVAPAPCKKNGVSPHKRPPLKLQAFGVSPQKNNPHTCTLIYLHGFCGNAKSYLERDCEWSYPWRLGSDYAPGLRVVLPTAPRLRQPWGEARRAWYSYCSKHRNGIGDPTTLAATRDAIKELLRQEIEKLGGAAERCFLGGLSQGCTVALDVYLREGTALGLGGFVGSVGFVPSDALGFAGADRAMNKLLRDTAQSQRPLWLQCATDDDYDVPWNLVRHSLLPVQGKLPGLSVWKVRGRGHCVDDWEASYLNDFLREHADDVYY